MSDISTRHRREPLPATGLVAGNKIMLCGNGGSAVDGQHVEDALC
jgi:phosphoheptose isomerase